MRDPTATRTPTFTREPTPTREPTATREATDTPVPIRTPRPTQTPRPDPTETPAPTPTLGPATVSGIEPESATCRQPLTVSGRNFGPSRREVDGKVLISGVEASVTSWETDAIRVTVPASVKPGNDRTLSVVVNGRSYDYRGGLRVSC
ncbi:MAG: IPT/TIG domain-containing protein [Chloroflexi bacterium]|nr:IPT/TIG domain-containing protein [Chloroflexota bacterium]